MVYNIKRSSLPCPPHSARASRLRHTLLALLADSQQHLRARLPLRQLVTGSVYELKTRCGKPTCHCASAHGPLHSSTVLSWSEKGKTRLRTLPAGQRPRFRKLTQHYRRFRQTRATLVQLQRRLLTTLDQLEKALRLPPPQPAARRRKP